MVEKYRMMLDKCCYLRILHNPSESSKSRLSKKNNFYLFKINRWIIRWIITSFPITFYHILSKNYNHLKTGKPVFGVGFRIWRDLINNELLTSVRATKPIISIGFFIYENKRLISFIFLLSSH